MKKQTLFIIAAVAIILSSCNNSDSKSGDAKKSIDSTKTTETKKENPNGRYALKSAIVEMKSEVMGMQQKQVLYFDEYGAKECSEITATMFGIKSQTLNLNKDGFAYSIDMVKKTGTKMKIPSKDANINFTNLGEEMAKEMNIKKVGTQSFLGKTCDKYTIDFKKQQMKGSYLVWKGIPLKTEMTIMGMKTLVEATKVEENPTIPSDKFEVPKGIKLKTY